MWSRLVRVVTPAAAVVVALLATAAVAQPLADRVPDDAMVYVGWRGSETMGDAYQQSHLKAVVDASDWRQFFDEFLPAVMDKVGQKDADAAEVMRVVSAIASPVWRHESAFYFGGLIAGQRNGPPSPKLAVLVRAGNDAPALVKEINDALHRAGRTPFPISVAAYGDLVAVTTGSWPGFEALLGAQNQAPAALALKANPKFVAAMSQVHKDPVAAVYVDAEAIVRMVDGFAALGAPPPQQHVWRNVRQIIGLGSVRQIAFTGGFDGKDWVTEGFVGAPAPRQGLLALMDGEPVSEEALKLIPQDVTLASVCRLDFAKAIARARTSVNAVDAEWGQTVDQVVAMGNQWAGIDIERDLFASLGEEWAAYASPVVGGNGFLGMAFVNRPRDSQKLEASLGILEKRVTDLIQQQTHGEPTVAFKTRKVDDLTLHYLAIPFVTPTYAIADGKLYVGLFPQVVVTAVNYAKHEGPTLLQNEKFAAVRKRLGGDRGVSSVAFFDLPRTAPNAYPSWLLISRYTGLADLFGIDSPLLLVPPIDRLMPELAPAGKISWTDDAGWHGKSVTPFPGADTLAQDPLGTLMTAQPALAVSIILPALNRARETANRVKSASNLRQIGIAMYQYADQHEGKFPATLGDVAIAGDLSADVFVSPSSNTAAPGNVVDKQKLAEWVNESSDFVYLGAGKTNHASPEDVLAYEKPDIHGHDGFNVLFGDGHIEWLNRDSGLKVVRQQEAKDKQPK